MFRTTTRRQREDARVAAFLHAIDLSARYAVNPDWTLQTVPDDQPTGELSTDTVQFPRIVLTASAQLCTGREPCVLEAAGHRATVALLLLILVLALALDAAL